MDVMELAKLVGRCATYSPSAGFDVSVDIVGVKQSYGRVRVEITPASGEGRIWVNLDSVQF